MKIFVHSIRVRLCIFSDYFKGLERVFSTGRPGKMPPKKKEEEKPTPLMGRIGTSLKCGIVGLPNVGFVFFLLYQLQRNCYIIQEFCCYTIQKFLIAML